jgi:hypothetical protein
MRNMFLISVMLLAVTTAHAQAEFLYERYNADGDVVAIYDWHQDITWMQDANIAQTSGYDADGKLSYDDSLTFISLLNYLDAYGVSTWRLPKMNYINNNGTGTQGLCDTDKGNNVDPASGEMAFMFYETLGLNAYYEPCTTIDQTPHGVTYQGPFININNVESDGYWYEDVYTGTSNDPEVDKTWVLHFNYGGQHADGQGPPGPLWPVVDEDPLYYLFGGPMPDDSRIDIDPSSAANELNPDSLGTVAVRIFGSPTLNAQDIDPATVRFGPYKAAPTDNGSLADNDSDTYTDLTIVFEIIQTGIQCGDTKAQIYGITTTAINGIDTFVGSDTIVTVDGIGCEDSSDQIAATVDIKPTDPDNRLNPASNGTVYVRVFGSADLDGASIDPATVIFGAGAAPDTTLLYNTNDSDGDGFADFSSKYHMQETGIVCGDTTVEITGQTFGGAESFIGSDAIITVDGQNVECEAPAGGDPEIPTIDIKPSDPDNRLNPASNGTVYVRVFGSADLDAANIDPDTVIFGDNAKPDITLLYNINDSDGDGFADFASKYHMQETGIACGDTSVGISGEVSGALFGGDTFVGSDSIITVDGQNEVCEASSCHP